MLRKYGWRWMGLGIVVLLVISVIWTKSAENTVRWVPSYPQADILPVLQQTQWSDEDYEILLTQTGLGRLAIINLLEQRQFQQILQIQQAFFDTPEISCTPNSIISREEHTVDSQGDIVAAAVLAPLEDGDILISPNSHTLGWRNGHAAIVIDAQAGLTLESVVLGEQSTIQSTEKWKSYPSFLVLRVSGLSALQRKEAARTAAERLAGVPYGLTIGIFSEKYTDGLLAQTHCAHLVWAAYQATGIDLDSNGGRIVTPRQLANSPSLELIQVYGMDPKKLWK